MVPTTIKIKTTTNSWNIEKLKSLPKRPSSFLLREAFNPGQKIGNWSSCTTQTPALPTRNRTLPISLSWKKSFNWVTLWEILKSLVASHIFRDSSQPLKFYRSITRSKFLNLMIEKPRWNSKTIKTSSSKRRIEPCIVRVSWQEIKMWFRKRSNFLKTQFLPKIRTIFQEEFHRPRTKSWKSRWPRKISSNTWRTTTK